MSDLISKFLGFVYEPPEEVTRHRGLHPWHTIGDAGEPTLQNNWYTDVESDKVRFMKDDYGLVTIESGLLSKSSGSGGTVFTLPVGFRPPGRVANIVLIGTAISFATVFGRLDITTAGNLVVQSNAKSLSFGSISFRL